LRRRHERGLTLIEATVALAVMLIGALGMLGLHRQGQRMNDDGLRITRASAIAQDLLNQTAMWRWEDPRLTTNLIPTNPNPANDLDVGDSSFAFEGSAPPFDYGEADLTLGGTTWLGIPSAEVQSAGYERYWNVSTAGLDGNGNGIADAMRIAAIVRWRSGLGWRRVVLLGVKNNPAESR